MWNPYRPLTKPERFLGAGAVLTLLLLWGLVSGLRLIEPGKLPAPWEVVSAFFMLLWDGERSLLLSATLWSASRIAVASLLVALVGVPLGVLMGASPRINALLSPLFDPFRSAPIVALLPIFVIWLGIGETMKVAFLFVSAVVYLVPMVRDAVVAVPRSYWLSSRDLGATEWEIVRLTLLPLAMPRIVDALIASVAIMWTYITVAEYVNATQGLGQLIQNARRFSAMNQVFVGIFVIIGLALLTYKAMKLIKERLYPWETTE